MNKFNAKEHQILKGKNIIFVGPQGNPTDEQFAEYDYVVRTNNFFGINKKHLNSQRCDILLCNSLYSNNHHNTIVKHLPDLKYCLFKAKSGYDKVRSICKKEFKKKCIRLDIVQLKHNRIEGPPLLLSKFIIYLLYNNSNLPHRFHVMGIDFYKGNKLKDIYPPGYMIEQAKDNHPLTSTNPHNTESNRMFLKYCVDRYDWITVDREVSNILNQPKILEKKKKIPSPIPKQRTRINRPRNRKMMRINTR